MKYPNIEFISSNTPCLPEEINSITPKITIGKKNKTSP